MRSVTENGNKKHFYVMKWIHILYLNAFDTYSAEP